MTGFTVVPEDLQGYAELIRRQRRAAEEMHSHALTNLADGDFGRLMDLGVTDFGTNLAQSWLWRGAVGFNAVILVVVLTASGWPHLAGVALTFAGGLLAVSNLWWGVTQRHPWWVVTIANASWVLALALTAAQLRGARA